MPDVLHFERWDVLVVGGGAAGIGAAVAAARNGARVLLVNSGPMVGGELVSGIPVDGCLSAAGNGSSAACAGISLKSATGWAAISARSTTTGRCTLSPSTRRS